MNLGVVLEHCLGVVSVSDMKLTMQQYDSDIWKCPKYDSGYNRVIGELYHRLKQR